MSAVSTPRSEFLAGMRDEPVRHPVDAVPPVATLLAAVLMWRSKSLLATVVVEIATFLILPRGPAAVGPCVRTITEERWSESERVTIRRDC